MGAFRYSPKEREKLQIRPFKWVCSNKNYKSDHLSHFFLPLSFQLAENDLTRLWKLHNGCKNVNDNLTSSTWITRSSTLCLFDVPKSKKVCSESNFFVRSTTTANALNQFRSTRHQSVALKFQNRARNYLLSEIANFDTSISCSLLVKCYCSFSRS